MVTSKMAKMTSRCRYTLQLNYIRGNVRCFFTFLFGDLVALKRKKKKKNTIDCTVLRMLSIL